MITLLFNDKSFRKLKESIQENDWQDDELVFDELNFIIIYNIRIKPNAQQQPLKFHQLSLLELQRLY